MGAINLISQRLSRYLLFDRMNRAYCRWQLDQFRPYLGRRILEIGCGVGGIIDLLGPRDLICGLDVEAEVLDYAAERFRHRPECQFELCDINETDSETLERLRGEEFDTIICMNVLEHIRDDIGALQRMEEVLAPGGALALLVPAHLGLYGPYDKVDGHFRRYSKAYLRTILQQTGLRLVRSHYFNAVGALGWWVQYKLLRRSIHGEGQLGLMNRLLPLVRAAEWLVKPPFGLSLIAVCRKESN
jgi:2-polyprenyl-3-methyl-5-hydroxy-6-metoxy-1,4-benzoquinol methylase